MTSTLRGSCRTCTSFDDEVPGGQAVCKYNPPSMTFVPIPGADSLGRPHIQIKPVTGWPPVHPGSWCGKWQGKLALGGGH
jgi:hypothetical protein